jgi:glycine/D-amino acid oxidase-like deaminating enzyme
MTSARYDENRSVWVADRPAYEAGPPLAASIRADVAIIGGGFTGVSTALHLSARFPDKRVVLLEARALGNGASGRNGGLALNWINGVDSADPELTRLVFETTRSGIDLIERTIREHGLDVDFVRGGVLDVQTDARRAEAAHAHAEELAAWGIPVRFVTGAELAARLDLAGAAGAVFDPTAGRLNGADLVRGLRPVLEARGVGIFEQTPVLRVREGRPVVLTTADGEVRADAIVLATNAYTPGLGYFRERIVPLHAHVFATEKRSRQEWAAMGWRDVSGFSDDLDRVAYGGLTGDGRLVFGGGSNASYDYLFGNRTVHPGAPERSFAVMRDRMVRYLPRAADLRLEHRWTGTLALTLNRQCAMGVRGDHRNVFYALGYSGHGVTLANLAGRVLCDLYAGDHDHWRKLPFYECRLPYVPSEPFRWTGYHVWTRLTGRSPRKTA